MGTLTQHRAVVAYSTIIRMGQKVAGKAAFSLFRLKQSLKQIVEFQSEEEMKLVEKYGATVTEDGRILPGDDAKKFAELVRSELPGAMIMGASACMGCKKCTYPDAPCRFPDKLCASMEGCGLVVNEVCTANGLKYNHGKDPICYTACFLLE